MNPYIYAGIHPAIRQIMRSGKQKASRQFTIPAEKKERYDFISNRVKCSPEQILEVTAEHFLVSPEQIKGNARPRNINVARQISIYLIRIVHGLTFVQIAAMFYRNHATIINSVHNVEDQLDYDQAFKDNFNQLIDKFNT